MKRRILFFSESSEPGGAETVFLTLVERFAQRSWDSVALLMNRGWLYDELRHRGIPPVCLTSDRSLDLFFPLRVARLVREKKIDLIHAHLPDSNAYGTLAGVITRVPVIATYHGLLETFGPLDWKDRTKLRLVRRLARRVVAVSEAMRNEFVTRAHFPPSQIVTIYNGIDWKELDAPVDRAEVRAELGLDPGTSVIGMIGAVRPVKGHVFAIRAMRSILAAAPQAQLLIAGSEEYPYRTELQDEIDSLGLSDSIRFLGFRQDIRRILRALDLFIMPSLSEGHPLATIEAMGAGLPVIASAVGGHPEIVTDGVTGYLVPPADESALADRVIHLLRHRDLGRELAARGRDDVRRRFSLEQMVQQHESLYEECLKGRGAVA